jgi:hypothetical protein
VCSSWTDSGFAGPVISMPICDLELEEMTSREPDTVKDSRDLRIVQQATIA